MIDKLKEKIEQWARNRGLDDADPVKQMLKLGEEYGELCAAVARDNNKQVIDAIGDMFVVMTIFCMQYGVILDYCIEDAYEEIKDRKGRMVNGVFVKEADLNG